MNGSSQFPDIEEVAAALGAVVTNGLPLPHDYHDERLLKLPCVLERCENPEDRLCLIAVLQVVLNEVLADFSDDERRDALRALFGVAPGMRTKKVGDRRQFAADEMERDKEHFRKRIEPKLIEALAMRLYTLSVDVLPRRPSTAPLRQEGLADLRQLYRHAQDALLYIESFNVMAYAVELIDGIAEVPHMWGVSSIGNQSLYTDQALWAFSNCLAAFRRIERDADACAYLRDGLPPLWWVSKLSKPFSGSQAELIEKTLAISRDAGEFRRNLRRHECPSSVEESWLDLLSSVDADDGSRLNALDRENLRVRLVTLCQSLELVAPEDKRSAQEMSLAFDSILFDILGGVAEYGTYKSTPEERQLVTRLAAAARENVPDHYIFGGTEKPLVIV